MKTLAQNSVPKKQKQKVVQIRIGNSKKKKGGGGQNAYICDAREKPVRDGQHRFANMRVLRALLGAAIFFSKGDNYFVKFTKFSKQPNLSNTF
jgi:hypothetical protein